MLEKWPNCANRLALLGQKYGVKMTKDSQPDHDDALVLRGRTLHESNPSLAGRFSSRLASTQIMGTKRTYMVSQNTGEILGEGAFGFVEEREVDSEQFVKVYLDGIKQYAQLSKAGAMLFEYLYYEISGSSAKDRDTVILNYRLVQRWKSNLARRTYTRGLSEMLDKEFIFKSLAADMYYVNVRYMFNGDRMVLVKAYRRKGTTQQQELALEPPLLLDDYANR
jgi:hypothetical protein